MKAGGTALDAVERAVRVLEDDPRFNAGTGAALNEAGLVELDAAVMEGATLRAGGVCALPPFRNPISIARAVLEAGGHLLYAGEGAAKFARAAGFASCESEHLTTEAARARWQAHRHGITAPGSCGTVGAVARDSFGCCAAATSTGGVVGKRIGRVGDSPLIGAGTYADEQGAVSATGHGEFIIRACLAKRVVDAMQKTDGPHEACASALAFLTDRLRARAGLIAVDRVGRLGIARSTKHMSWAACRDGISEIVAGL